jgi:phosphoribosyl 1,2-cyclic phosphodiesterase
MEDGFVIRFRGVRGGHPVPGKGTLRYGGNTSCVEVWAGERLLILDAGTGIVALGHDLMHWHQQVDKPIVATMLFSHAHHDHMQGFPFFVPAYQGSSTLYMFGPKTFDQDLEEALSRAMLAPTFPVSLEELPSLKIISNIHESEVILIGSEHQPQIRNVFREPIETDHETVRVDVLRSSFHPSGNVSLLRIAWNGKSMVYATDTEGLPGGDSKLIELAAGCDLLIHDAQYTQEEYLGIPRQGWGHSTPEMAVTVAKKAGAQRLILFHHDPTHDDAQLDTMQAHAETLLPGTLLAYEGLTIRL